MFKIIVKYVLAMALAFASGLVVSQESIPAPTFQVGDTWVNNRTDGFSKNERLSTSTVMAVGEVVENSVDSNSGKQTAQFTPEGNFKGMGNRSFAPYRPSYKFPLVVGSEWKERFTVNAGGDRVTGGMTAKVISRETIKVPAGEFDTWKIEANFWFDGRGKATEVYWYSPMVKRAVRLEFKDYGSSGMIGNQYVDVLVGFRVAGEGNLVRCAPGGGVTCNTVQSLSETPVTQ